MTEEDADPGWVGLTEAIEALRDALVAAWWDGQRRRVRFKVEWSPGIFVDISIMLLLVPNCQIGARNPLGLSCRADVVSGRDCNIARCSRTRRS